MKLKLVSEQKKKEITDKIKSKIKKPQIQLDFLDDELKEFISKVTDVTRRKWLKNYTEEQLEKVISNCYEWCSSNDREPKNVAGLLNKFMKDIPTKNGNESISQQLDDLLKGGNDA